jgi:apolipoprotein D and lipocalin family protein
MKKQLLASLLCLCSTHALPAQNPADSVGTASPGTLDTIASLDLNQYLGTWYEIGRYPNRFQKSCARDTTAEYSFRPDGNVQVINRCRTRKGDLKEAKGLAKPVGAPGTAKLKVRFAPAWLSFIPAVWGDYWVIDLDEHYQLAAVSDPDRTYLWILSRTPSIRSSDYDALLARLKNKGFDLRKLIPTLQSGR